VSETEARACLTKLEVLVAKFDEIFALLGDKRRLHGEEQRRAQDVLRQLKAALRDEYARMVRAESAGDLSYAERTWYMRPVQQASARMNVRVNSVPDQRWFHDLYSPQGDLKHAAIELRAHLKLPLQG